MDNPQERCPDDTRCVACNKKLPDNPQPDTPPWDGYCNDSCRNVVEIFEGKAKMPSNLETNIQGLHVHLKHDDGAPDIYELFAGSLDNWPELDMHPDINFLYGWICGYADAKNVSCARLLDITMWEA